jgi:chaperonin GroES|tara:strand:- start:650 stop:1069 length:420 start_codon:yes stop_codon:yes gene_type:complete
MESANRLFQRPDKKGFWAKVSCVLLDRPAGSFGPNVRVLNQEKRMSIRPLQDRVVVRRMEEETKSAGGIVIPGSAAEKPSQGEVLSVGPGKKLDNGSVQNVDLSVGDKVLFGQYSGSTVKVDGEELLIMSESEIFGVIE